MQIIDISVPIQERMPIFTDNPPVKLTLHQAHPPANVSRLDFGCHTGTHVDAPYHFYKDGATGESIPLEPLLGPALVADDTPGSGPIDADTIARMKIPAGTERVLLRTTNSWLWERSEFTTDYRRLDASGAQAVIDAGIKLIGIDYLSIGDEEAHLALLGEANVIPLEGLDLRHVEPGEYDLFCLPLRLTHSDGVPSRAVLVRR